MLVFVLRLYKIEPNSNSLVYILFVELQPKHALEKGNWELFDYTFLSRSPSGVTFSLGKHHHLLGCTPNDESYSCSRSTRYIVLLYLQKKASFLGRRGKNE